MKRRKLTLKEKILLWLWYDRNNIEYTILKNAIENGELDKLIKIKVFENERN